MYVAAIFIMIFFSFTMMHTLYYLLSEQEVISEQGKIKKSSPASVFDKVKKCEQEGKNLQNSYEIMLA